MKKYLLAVALIAALGFMGSDVRGQTQAMPTDNFAVPQVAAWVAICVWDSTGVQWIARDNLWKPRTYDFALPAWERWYWIGIWDYTAGAWIKGTWVAHFR